MNGRAFVDTNVLAYLFDARQPGKMERARKLVDERGGSGDLVVSTQVMAELYVVLTRKLRPPIPEEDAEDVLRALTSWQVVPADADLVLAAARRQRASRLSLWDALIVEAALSAGCELLYSEDLQDGQRFGSLRVLDPLAGAEAY